MEREGSGPVARRTAPAPAAASCADEVGGSPVVVGGSPVVGPPAIGIGGALGRREEPLPGPARVDKGGVAALLDEVQQLAEQAQGLVSKSSQSPSVAARASLVEESSAC